MGACILYPSLTSFLRVNSLLASPADIRVCCLQVSKSTHVPGVSCSSPSSWPSIHAPYGPFLALLRGWLHAEVGEVSSTNASSGESSEGWLQTDPALVTDDFCRLALSGFRTHWLFRRTSKGPHVLPSLKGSEMGHQCSSIKDNLRDCQDPVYENAADCG